MTLLLDARPKTGALIMDTGRVWRDDVVDVAQLRPALLPDVDGPLGAEIPSAKLVLGLFAPEAPDAPVRYYAALEDGTLRCADRSVAGCVWAWAVAVETLARAVAAGRRLCCVDLRFQAPPPRFDRLYDGRPATLTLTSLARELAHYGGADSLRPAIVLPTPSAPHGEVVLAVGDNAPSRYWRQNLHGGVSSLLPRPGFAVAWAPAEMIAALGSAAATGRRCAYVKLWTMPEAK